MTEYYKAETVDKMLEALRARIRTLEGLVVKMVEASPSCPVCGWNTDDHWPDCELKAALDGALGQANGHDDAAGSCPPKREDA